MDRYQKLVSEKAKNKRSLLGSTFFPRTPVVLIDLSHIKKVKEYLDLLEGIHEIGLHTFVIASDKNKDLPQSQYLHIVTPARCADAYKAADFAIVLDGSSKDARDHHCVPIAQLDGDTTVDYNAVQEKGNGFYFKKKTKWEIFAALIRGLETYQFPYDWENLVRSLA